MNMRRAVYGKIPTPQTHSRKLHHQPERKIFTMYISGGMIAEQGHSVLAIAVRHINPVEQDIIFDTIPGSEERILQPALGNIKRRIFVDLLLFQRQRKNGQQLAFVIIKSLMKVLPVIDSLR